MIVFYTITAKSQQHKDSVATSVIKVVDNGLVMKYNLSSVAEAKEYISYLQSLPIIKDSLALLLPTHRQNDIHAINVLIAISKESLQNGFLDTSQYGKRLFTYLKDCRSLYTEVDSFAKDISDTAFNTTLQQAARRLAIYDRAGYDDALADYQQKWAAKPSVKSHVALTYYLQAKSSYYSLQYKSALLLVDKAIKLESDTKYMLLQAEVQLVLQQLDEALNSYLHIAAITDKIMTRAVCYTSAGVVYGEKKDFDKALEFYQKGLAIYKDDTTQLVLLAKIYNNMGGAYKEKGMLDTALEYHLKSLAIKEQLWGKDDISTAVTYNNISSIYREKKDYETTLQYLKKTLYIEEKESRTDHPEVIITYNNLGFTYAQLHYNDSALACHKKALEISKRVFGDQHPTTAIAYNGIGNVYQDRQMYDTAIVYFKKSLNINEHTLGNHPTVIIDNINIARVYNAYEKNDSAIVYYKKAITIAEDFPDAQAARIATLYNDLAIVYNEALQPTQALEAHKSALHMRQKLYGSQHNQTVQSYYNIGASYYYILQPDSAIKYLNKAVDVWGQMAEKDKAVQNIRYYLVGSYNLLADTLAMRQQIKLIDFDNYKLAKALTKDGYSFFKQQKFLASISISELALHLLENTSTPKNDNLYLNLYYNMGNAYCKAGQHERGLASFQYGIDAAKGHANEDDLLTKFKKSYDDCKD